MSVQNQTAPASGTDTKFIDVRPWLNRPVLRGLADRFPSAMDRLLGLDTLNRLYEKARGQAGRVGFLQASLETLGVNYSVSREDLQKIPTKGPLIVVCNHPFGFVEGLIAMDILTRVRPDVKVLGNLFLQQVAELRPYIVPVDVFAPRGANAAAIKESLRLLRGGGTLVVFPAGEVAHISWRNWRVTEQPWTSHVGALVRHARAPVLPMFFAGRNSWAFQAAGLAHPLLRTAMLPRSLADKRGRLLSVYVGKAFSWKKLAALGDDAEVAAYLRLNTLFLGNRAREQRQSLASLVFPKAKVSVREELIPPVAPALLRSEVAGLPGDALFAESEDSAVFIAQASQMPNLLQEIGRLREATFREVQEGTGKSADIDAFDSYYLHLFLWNKTKSELVGAYRMGLTDRILRERGPQGLYTTTLFHYKPGFLEQLGAAIELGRSFIRSEYQREFSCLSMLWRGIGQFIVRNPRYKVLIGPVSISEDYQAVSKNLMVQFLRQFKMDPVLARFVRPRFPFRPGAMKFLEKSPLRSIVRDIDDVSLLISEIEKDGKGIPILLRHYLKLNAALLSFNVDRQFSNVVDGLMMVDVTTTDPRILRRFMGEAGLKTFARHHGMRLEDVAAETPAGAQERD